jgi:hypothetical protein
LQMSERIERMVGERRFELPTSASRTLRANQTALLPEFYSVLSTSASRTLRANQTALLPEFCAVLSTSASRTLRANQAALLPADNILYYKRKRLIEQTLPNRYQKTLLQEIIL